ncbi:transporter substrate-binding domain-containing protein [Microbacterium gallinarum]|jgi:polar amino acid transport system substrate-binding protein|uniref:Transporter substrate-binding domain-containing protein n=1 Tax=Microbacterium gallinarum TaxID=2762209 RepID=A0ABR8X2X5_9MICO|nr:transporter substrate-binding domain-containing protein [Microbacterium gallinarum]MBD8023246.1 transporter substrate-binding domain-containing protein [Microbacterium gallinarum]
MNTTASSRILVGLAACTALGLALAGCAGDSGGDDAGGNGGSVAVAGVTIEKNDELAAMVPDDVVERGTLTAIQFDNAPADTFVGEDDQITGWGPDLGRAVAGLLGLEYTAEVSGAFDTFIPGIENGRFDTSWASIIVTQERLDVVDIVAVHESTTGVITTEDADLDISTPEDLCGLRVGALAGSAFLIQLEEIIATCEEAGEDAPTVDSFPQQGAALLAVSSDRIDAFMTAKGQLSWLVREDSSAEGLEIQPLDYQPNLEGVAVGKDSGLTEAIAAAMNQLIEDGSYEEIMGSWDIDFGLLDEAVVNPDVAQ